MLHCYERGGFGNFPGLLSAGSRMNPYLARITLRSPKEERKEEKLLSLYERESGLR